MPSWRFRILKRLVLIALAALLAAQISNSWYARVLVFTDSCAIFLPICWLQCGSLSKRAKAALSIAFPALFALILLPFRIGDLLAFSLFLYVAQLLVIFSPVRRRRDGESGSASF